jgi:predicted DNA-binding transcriptional regulator YafY
MMTTMKANYSRDLELLLLLTESARYTPDLLAKKLGITKRSVYNYLKQLRDSGFLVYNSGNNYYIDRWSPYFRQLFENLSFSTDEARFLNQLLSDVDNEDLMVRSIRSKLERHYYLGEEDDGSHLHHINSNLQTLRAAIAAKKVVVLKNYSSPHSRTVADRYVEPFQILNNGLDIRCHEIMSHKNKTYRLARIESVQILDAEWTAEKKHREVYTDIFLFSGEEQIPVSLRMGQLAHNLMLEEYPLSSNHFTQEDDKHWLLTIDVCSYAGIGRFVLGLFEDIEVLSSPEFIKYLQEKIKGYQIK